MDKWQRETLIRNRVKLVNSIQLNSSLYSELRAKGIIGRRQEDRWKRLGSMEAQVEELLDHLARRPTEEYWHFIDALQNSHPDHQELIDILKPPQKGLQNSPEKPSKAPSITSKDQQCRPSLLRELLRVNRVKLVNILNLTEGLYTQLRSRGIIGWTEEQQLRVLPEGPFQTESLLSHVEQLSDDGITKFYEALSNCQPSQGNVVDQYFTTLANGATNVIKDFPYRNVALTGASGIGETEISPENIMRTTRSQTGYGMCEAQNSTPHHNSIKYGIQETGQMDTRSQVEDHQVSGQRNIELLTMNRVPLVNGINIRNSGLYNILRSKRIIGMRQEQEWKHLGAEESQAEALLDYITLERPDAFEDVCEALISSRPSQKHLVDLYLTDTNTNIAPNALNGDHNADRPNRTPCQPCRKRKSDDSISAEIAENNIIPEDTRAKRAAMNIKAELKEQVTCPICLETFQDPKGLPCQHSFCLGCLQDHSKANHVAGSTRQFLCPVCRAVTSVPEGGVSYFPNALAVQNILLLM